MIFNPSEQSEREIVSAEAYCLEIIQKKAEG